MSLARELSSQNQALHERQVTGSGHVYGCVNIQLDVEGSQRYGSSSTLNVHPDNRGRVTCLTQGRLQPWNLLQYI